jgi:Flp pilus assembly protein CpaB
VKRSNRLVILVGVLLAVLAFVGIVILLNGNTGGTSNEKPKTVTVMIAKADIAIGDPVTPEKVEAKDVAAEAVLGTRIASATQLTGSPALYDIPKGAQVSQEAVNLVGGNTVCVECQLKPGERAIAFQVDRVTGLDFLLQPGDHIDVVAASDVQPVQETQDSILARKADKTLPPRYELVNGLNNFRTVKAILQDRRVLYVSATRIKSVQAATATPSPGQAAQAQPQQDLEVVIIVIAGTDQDAELIKFAQSNLGEQGALTAILRDTQDTESEVKTTGVSLELLIRTYGVPIPNLIVLPTPGAKP